MNKYSLSFDNSQLNSLFPFFLLIDKSHTVIAAGDSMLKIIPDLLLQNIASVFEIRSNEPVLKEEILFTKEKFVFLYYKTQTNDLIKFKGQFESFDSNELILFAGSLIVDSFDQINKMRLKTSDFAKHNSLIELLTIQESKESNNESIQNLISSLNAKKNELKKLSYIAEEATTSAIITTPSGEIEWVNKYFEYITGYCGKEAIGNCISDFLLGPRTDIKTVNYIKDQLNGALPFSCEILYYSKNSKPFWAKINGQPIFNQEGQLVNFFAITEDISKNKKLEIKLTSTALRLSTLISNLNSGILLESEKGIVLLANQKYCELFDINTPASELQGQYDSVSNYFMRNIFINEESYEIRTKAILENRKLVQQELLELKDGRFFERDFVPIWNEGYYLGHMWVFNDVTERKQYDKQLKDQRAFYENILNNIPADIAVYDKDRRYKFVNPVRIEDKVVREWALGKTDLELAEYMNLPLSSLKDKLQVFDAVFKEKNEISWQEKRENIHKVLEDYLYRINPIVNENNKIEMLFSYGMNITEQKKIEEQLKKSQIEIEAAAKTKTQFLANMSHEIRTPMSGIIGIASLLEKTNLDIQQKEYLDIIIGSANNLFSIVNSILDLEKISAGKLYIEEIPFRISEKINGAIDLFRFKAEEKDILLLIENNLPEDLVVSGDPYRLSQILNNLLDNAIKFTNKGFVKVYTNILSSDRDSLLVEFQVKDSGIGISEDNLSLIFAPYEQADKDTSRKYGGTGLGLSISKNLIEMQEGQMNVQSKLGHGTEFLFSIPYKVASNDLLSSIDLKLSNEIKLSNIKFLVAEDINVNQFLLRHIIKSWDSTVIIAENGEEALNLFENQDFDIILMDIQMPVMDGLEATGRIRKMENTKKAQIPIIALTAHALRGDNKKYIEAGMNAYLSKPFNERELLNIVIELLQLNPDNIEIGDQDKNESDSNLVNEEIYSLKQLNELSSGDKDFVKNMVNLFLSSVPTILEEAKSAFKDENYQKLYKAAHKLKPMIDTLCIYSLKDIIRNIENAAMEETNLEMLQEKMNILSSTLIECITRMKSEI